MSDEPARQATPRPVQFATTRWSLVAHSASNDARAALAELCTRYRYPVYAYLRRCGHEPVAARDLADSFFAMLLAEGEGLPQHGRFRAYLLDALHRYLASDRRISPAAAGAGRTSSEIDPLEHRARHELPERGTPDQVFAQGFALEVLSGALGKLKLEALGAGRTALFERLEPWLAADPPPGTHDTIARDVGMQSLAVAIALRRLRERFRELVDRELIDTVGDADTLASERASLARVLAGTAG
ncbi:MAG TPA: hypothetical protein VND91_03935 [Candidatus Saccharimonadia bacterium]|nr:hypothetical protein [Candidatus Saccharimonadia bacterium]